MSKNFMITEAQLKILVEDMKTETNEGSDGKFMFDFNNTTIQLEHTYNTEENSTDTIFEERFAD